MFLFGNSSADTGIGMAMSSVDAVITDHFKMFFRDVAHESFDKVHSRNGLMNKEIIFMSVVVEGNGISNLVIGVDAGGGNNGTAKIAANVVEDRGRIAFVALSVNVETVFGIAINGSFEAFEFRRKLLLKQIEEDGLESMAEEGIVEVRNGTPEAKLIDAAFGDKAVNMGIPF